MNDPTAKSAGKIGQILYRVEFSVHLKFDKGQTTFVRVCDLPFVPFIGLDVLDDVLGQFEIKHVAWTSRGNMFLCQANENAENWTIRKACAAMRKADWAEDREAREMNN